MQILKAFSILPLSLLAISCCERKSYPPKKPDETLEDVVTTPSERSSSERSMTILGEIPNPQKHILPLTKKIHALIKPHPGEMKPYTETIPKSDGAKFDLVPIPGGTLILGSPNSEADRADDEGPQREIKIEPFWMATTETTWGLYRSFMENGAARNKDGTLNLDSDIMSPEPPLASNPELIDAISQPTPPYMPMHFDMGDNAGYDPNYPAIAMTQHAASKFCEWLTLQTGHYYRLPTEAEWEYACRAGTTTAYSFGDDANKLDEYAWYIDNSDFSYQPVGKKKPNPWGLFDMHGNVCEWTLDAYQPNYQAIADGSTSPLALTSKRYPRVTRGGHWDSDPQDLRSAARLASEINWKMTDPQQPKSIWYHTDTHWLGFRVIRPAATPTVEEVHLLWNTGPGRPF